MSKVEQYSEMLKELLFLFQSGQDECIDKLMQSWNELDVMQSVITTGTKIRDIRQFRDKTRLGIAVKCDVTRSALGHYERGTRFPDEATLAKIADQLDVPPATLQERHLSSLDDCIHALFEIEDTGAFHSLLFQDVLALWKVKREQLAAGELTQEEYQKWKWELRITQESERRKNDHENNAE